MLLGSEDVLAEMAFLNVHYQSTKFQVGSNTLQSTRYGWRFSYVGGSTTSSGVSVVQRNFQALVYSGIYLRLNSEIARNKYLPRKPIANDTIRIVAPIRMDGRITTIFILCGTMTGFALVALIVEGYKYEWRVIVKAYVTFASLIVKCSNVLHEQIIKRRRINCKKWYCLFRCKVTIYKKGSELKS